MEEAKYDALNGPRQSSPTSVLTSPPEEPTFITPDDNPELLDDDDDNNTNTNTTHIIPPKEVPDTFLPMEEEEEEKEHQSHIYGDNHSHHTLQVKENNAAAQSEDDSSDGHMDNHSHHESHSSTTLQVKENNAAAQSEDDSSDGHMDQQEHAVNDETESTSSRDLDSPKPTNEELPEGKVVARPSSDDDSIVASSPGPAPASTLRRWTSLDQIVVKAPPTYLARVQSAKPSKVMHNIDLSRGQIDTAAPFESVKAAVSKFGGIVDWKAHREHSVERHKFIEQKLEKAQEEKLTYKKQSEEAEEAKMQVQKELNHTIRLIEELKLKLEMAHKEEENAKQGAELAKLRVKEMEKGIADGTSLTATAQLEVARAKHAAALAELNTTKDELEQVRKQYTSLLAEKDEATRKTEEAETASKEAEKSVKEMEDELLTLKQSLKPARSAHLEIDELRIEAVIAQELENITWEEEMKLPMEELEKLNEQMLSTKDVRTRLGEAMELLQHTKTEMTNYMESESEDTGKEVNLEDMLMESKKNNHKAIETAVTAAKVELAEVEQKIEKATEEVNTLKVSATALKSELDKESSELAAIHLREKATSNAFKLLEAEVIIIKSELTIVQMKADREKQEAVEDLPKRIQQAAEEADQAKALAQTAKSALQKAKEETEQAKAEASAMECNLLTAQNEIEAARASEKLALAAINVLAKNKSALRDSNEDSPNEVTLSVEEYYEITKRVHIAEEQANTRVAAALSQVEAAKESKAKNFNRLEEVKCEIASRKEALELALQKADKAEEEKLAVEQELIKWKVEHEEESKPVESVSEPSESPTQSFEESQSAFSLPTSSGLHQRSTTGTYTKSKIQTESSTTTVKLSSDTKIVPMRKKKRSFFPRFFMFLFKRKAPSSMKIA